MPDIFGFPTLDLVETDGRTLILIIIGGVIGGYILWTLSLWFAQEDKTLFDILIGQKDFVLGTIKDVFNIITELRIM